MSREMNICTESRKNQRKVAAAKKAGNEKEVERLKKERYTFQRKNEVKQKDSSGAKIGAGILLGAVLGAAAVYGVSKALNNDSEKEKQGKQIKHWK